MPAVSVLAWHNLPRPGTWDPNSPANLGGKPAKFKELFKVFKEALNRHVVSKKGVCRSVWHQEWDLGSLLTLLSRKGAKKCCYQ
eukprot:s1702_g7.t1